MLLPDRVYDVMKWICMVLIPACASAFVGLDSVFGWGYGDTVAKISAIVCTLMGALLGISTAEYRRGEPPDQD